VPDAIARISIASWNATICRSTASVKPFGLSFAGDPARDSNPVRVGLYRDPYPGVGDFRQALFVRDSIGFQPKVDAPVKPNPIQGKLAGLSIMVVEDGADNQRIFRHFLKMAGADFVIIPDGPSALERALHDEGIDLVLMDIQLPEMDGYEVTERLRESGFTRPIIAVTAHTLSMERPRGATAGITDYIAKPIQIETLIQTILHHTRPDGKSAPENPPVVPDEASVQDAQDSLPYLQSKYHHKPMYRPIIIDFVNAFQQRIETMQNLINAMDWDQLSVAMHQIKGAAATYGYPQVSEVAAQMEHTAKEARRDAYAVQTLRLLAERMRGMGDKMKVGLEEVENRSV
jgi:CheY-like chemotaxis protein/HPt (histidine-containing phosphotransfer) domain-containing protein